jgi:hypothetical protein
MNDYFERLETQLAELTKHGAHLVPASSELGRRRGWWGGALVPVMATALAIVIAAIVLISVHAANPSARQPRQSNIAPAARQPRSAHYPRSIAYIRRRMQEAEDADRDEISVSTSTFVPFLKPRRTSPVLRRLKVRAGSVTWYRNRSWFDPVTRAQLSEYITTDGIQSEIAETVSRTPGMVHWHYTQLDFANHTWHRYTESNRATPNPAPRSLSERLLNRRACPYAVAGQATVDGYKTIILKPANTKGAYCQAATVWVNSTTYQIVRMVSPGGVYGTTTMDSQWIPRTRASEALTIAQIPTGFTYSITPPPFNPSAY